MEEVRTIRENDEGNRHIGNDKITGDPRNCRDQLEDEIKDIFIWAVGQTALTEMTKTVREKERKNALLFLLHALSRFYSMP